MHVVCKLGLLGTRKGCLSVGKIQEVELGSHAQFNGLSYFKRDLAKIYHLTDAASPN